MPIEIDILGHSCDVVGRGSLLKTASIRRLLSVLTSIDSAKSLRILPVKLLRNAKLRSRISLGHRLKKTLLQPDAEVDNVPGVTRNLCYLSVLSQMKRAIPWKTEDESGRRLCEYGEPFSTHVWKARDITSTKIFCDLSKRLPTTSAGLLIRLSLTTSLLQRKIRHLALTEFHMVPTGVPGVWARNSSSAIPDCFC